MPTTRITALRHGRQVPFYATAPVAALSPSPSLLIETHAIGPIDWLSQRLPAQILTMMLRPCDMYHAEAGGPVQRYLLPQHAVLLCGAGTEASVRWSNPVALISVSVRADLVADAARDLAPADRAEMRPTTLSENAHLATLLLALHLEQAGGYAAGCLFLDGMAQALAAQLACRNTHATALLAPLAAPDATPRCMRRVRDYILENLDQTLRMKELAQCAGLSEGHFARLFRSSFQSTPHQFVLRQRIDRAKSLLRTPRHSIIDIGLMCGFPNPQHFARIFHRLVGAPPSRFRRLSA